MKKGEVTMTQWNIDPDHSMATFSIKHLMITNIHGQCPNVSGAIHFDPADPTRSSVEATLDVTKLTTGIKKRDEHLMSADFFEVAKYPQILFKSSKVEIGKGNRGKITGELTMHGITRPVIMDVQFSGPVKSPEDVGGETSIGFTATTVINREDYGIMWNMPLDSWGLLVGKEVQITLDIEADRVE
jgi:polyisoprenoid-binding protein YceI